MSDKPLVIFIHILAIWQVMCLFLPDVARTRLWSEFDENGIKSSSLDNKSHFHLSFTTFIELLSFIFFMYYTHHLIDEVVILQFNLDRLQCIRDQCKICFYSNELVFRRYCHFNSISDVILVLYYILALVKHSDH